MVKKEFKKVSTAICLAEFIVNYYREKAEAQNLSFSKLIETQLYKANPEIKAIRIKLKNKQS